MKKNKYYIIFILTISSIYFLFSELHDSKFNVKLSSEEWRKFNIISNTNFVKQDQSELNKCMSIPLTTIYGIPPVDMVPSHERSSCIYELARRNNNLRYCNYLSKYTVIRNLINFGVYKDTNSTKYCYNSIINDMLTEYSKIELIIKKPIISPENIHKIENITGLVENFKYITFEINLKNNLKAAEGMYYLTATTVAKTSQDLDFQTKEIINDQFEYPQYNSNFQLTNLRRYRNIIKLKSSDQKFIVKWKPNVLYDEKAINFRLKFIGAENGRIDWAKEDQYISEYLYSNLMKTSGIINGDVISSQIINDDEIHKIKKVAITNENIKNHPSKILIELTEAKINGFYAILMEYVNDNVIIESRFDSDRNIAFIEKNNKFLQPIRNNIIYLHKDTQQLKVKIDDWAMNTIIRSNKDGKSSFKVKLQFLHDEKGLLPKYENEAVYTTTGEAYLDHAIR